MKRGNSVVAKVMKSVVGSAVLAVLGTGCASLSSMQTARVLEPGKAQSNFGGGMYQASESSLGVDLKANLPYVEYTYRQGLAKDWDAGFKLTIIGTAAVDAKYQLYADDKWAVSTGAGLGYLSYKTSVGETSSETNVYDLTVPLYLSYDVNKSFTPYLSPKYMLRMESSDAGSVTRSLVGATGGVKIGEEKGVYLEATYVTQPGKDFKAMQYNVSFFWEPDTLFKF